MSTFSKRVGHSQDDGWKDSYGLKTTTLAMGHNGSRGIMYAFVRFLNVTIPKGSTITAATIKLKASGLYDAVYIKVQGFDYDNVDVISDPSALTLTTAISSEWRMDNGTYWGTGNIYTSPSLVNIVQEIIDRDGWASGNAMGFSLFDDGGSGYTSEADAVDYNADPNNAALLEITYTPPADTTKFFQLF